MNVKVEENTVPFPEVKSQAIRKLGVLNCGEIACRVEVVNPCLAPKQTPEILVSFINDSTVAVKAIKMSLLQRSVHYPDPTMVNYISRSDEVSQSLCRSKSPCVNFNQTPRQKRTKRRVIEWEPKQVQEELFRMPPVPEKALHSYQGNYHYVRHEIKVTLITERNHSNVVIRVPVTISKPKGFDGTPRHRTRNRKSEPLKLLGTSKVGTGAILASGPNILPSPLEILAWA